MRNRRTTAATLVAGALVASGALLPTSGATSQEAPGCAPPYSPVAYAEVAPAQEELPAVDAAPVGSTPPLRPPFDSDGDGIDDVVTVTDGSEARISRGDGDVVITLPGGAFAAVGGVGDLDGDGRDEVAITIGPDAEAGSGLYVLPGTTPPGTATAADVGIRVGIARSGAWGIPDGSGRLVVSTLSESGDSAASAVLDGVAVLAAGPGTEPAGVTLAEAPGQPTAYADLGDPQLALVFVGPGPGDTVVHVVEGTTVTPLTHAPEPLWLLPGVGASATVTVLAGPDGRFVRLDLGSRSGTQAYLWSLDDPCTTLGSDDDPPAEGTVVPQAPPAAAVPAEATFTG